MTDAPCRAEAGSHRDVLYPPPAGGDDQGDPELTETSTQDPAVWGPFCWT